MKISKSSICMSVVHHGVESSWLLILVDGIAIIIFGMEMLHECMSEITVQG